MGSIRRILLLFDSWEYWQKVCVYSSDILPPLLNNKNKNKKSKLSSFLNYRNNERRRRRRGKKRTSTNNNFPPSRNRFPLSALSRCNDANETKLSKIKLRAPRNSFIPSSPLPSRNRSNRQENTDSLLRGWSTWRTQSNDFRLQRKERFPTRRGLLVLARCEYYLASSTLCPHR